MIGKNPPLIAHNPWALRLASLNVNGLGDAAKRRHLHHHIHTNHYDVVYLQETHAQQADMDELVRFWNGPSFWTTTPTRLGRRNGVAILLNRKRFTVDDAELVINDDENGQFIAVRLRVAPNVHVNLINVYAPSKPHERTEYYDKLHDKLDGVNPADHTVLCGDFNCVLDPQLDRVSTSDSDRNALAGSTELLALTAHLAVSDAWRHHHPTTRMTSRRASVATRTGSQTTGSRIDRAYVDDTLLRHADVSHIRHNISDHDLVLVDVHVPAVVRGRSYWKMNVSLLKDDAFYTDVRGIIKSTWLHSTLDPSRRWDLLKHRVRTAALFHSSRINDERQRTLLSAQLAHQNALDTWHRSSVDANAAVLASARAAWEQQLEYAYQGAAVRSRTKALLHGERATRYFCRQERRHIQATVISELNHPLSGDAVSDSADLLDAATSFYSNLYRPERDIDDAAADQLLAHMPTLNAFDSAQVDTPISAADLLNAIQHAPTGKTPGLDGLPADFYKRFADQLVPLLVEVLNHATAAGRLPESMCTGVLTLLHKKGDNKDLSNYRPLSMLTADYKLIASAVNQRMQPSLQTLVHPDQKGFVPGRHITEHLALQRFVQAHCARTSTKAVFVTLDQAKAFDRVHWRWRDRVLQHCGFGPGIRSLISLLHQDASFKITINGHISAPSPLLRGTRQGDPLSPTLYALCDEPFACALRADVEFQGIASPDDTTAAKLAQFADDKGVYCGSNGDIQRLQHHLDVYERASGANINSLKSHALLLGGATRRDFPSLRFPVMHHNDSTKYLGILVGPNVTDNDQWNRAISKFNGVLGAWSARSLTFAGKITVLKTLALSTLSYVGSIVPASAAHITAIDKACWRFLNGGKKDDIARGTLLLPRQLGGLGAPDFASIFAAMQLQWLRRLLNDSDRSTWKAFAWADLLAQSFARKWSLGRRAVLAPSAISSANCSSFWRDIINSAHQLGLSEPSPTTFEEVYRQHLFHNNRIIGSNGKALGADSSDKHHLQKAVREGVVIAGQARQLQGSALFAFSSNKIHRAMPHPWRVRLQLGPTAHDSGDWLVSTYDTKPDQLFHVISRQQDVLLVDEYKVDANNVVLRSSPSPLRITQTAARSRLSRARVTIDNLGWRFRGRLQDVPLLPSTLTIAQRDLKHAPTRAPILDITVRETTAALTALKTIPVDFAAKWPGITVAWKRVLRWIWAPLRDRRVNDFLFKIIHRKLPLGERRYWDPLLNVSCPCGTDLESFEHLFGICSVARSVWTWFFSAWHAATGRHIQPNLRNIVFASLPPAKIRKSSKAYWRLLTLAHTEAIYSIWLTRNRWVFDGDPYSSIQIKALACSRILAACQAATPNHNINGFSASFESLYATLEATVTT